MIKHIENRDRMILALCPEGTRKKTGNAEQAMALLQTFFRADQTCKPERY